MGKGGESNINVPNQHKLSTLSDDALRSWAKAYGLKEAETGKREQLLELLVNQQKSS